MAAKKRKKRKTCRRRPCTGTGQFKKGGGRVKRGTCAYKGQMSGSRKGGKPKRRRSTTCLSAKRRKNVAKRRKAPARKRSAAKRGVMVKGRRVYGAAAKAVQRKRARGGAKPKRQRAVRGRAGASIGSISREEARIEHEIAELNRDLANLEDLRHVPKRRRRRR